MERRRAEAIEFAGTDLERVELSMPASPELWSLARMTAAAVAALIDFGYDEIADLRLAIDELCTLCVSGDLDRTTLLLGYSWAGDEILITCSAPADESAVTPAALAALPDDPAPETGTSEVAPALTRDELSARILDALVDEHGLRCEGAVRRGWIRKRRAPPALAES